MKDPAVQAQTQQLSQVMQSPEMMKKMAELQVSCTTHANYLVNMAKRASDLCIQWTQKPK